MCVWGGAPRELLENVEEADWAPRACYEFIEWGTAVATGSKAEAFLGTQGDPWDTQWDMLWDLIGAITSQMLLAPAHNREIARLESSEPSLIRWSARR